MCVNKSETGGKVKMQGAEIVKVDEFKYLGSTRSKVEVYDSSETC